MKTFLLLGQIVLSVILVTVGCNHISKPSNLFLLLGLVEIIVGLLAAYRPFRTLIKQL